ISNDGRFRGIFVNRKQEDYLNNQQGYIQSIGVSYRQEFNTFKELGKLLIQTFKKKNKKTTQTPTTMPASTKIGTPQQADKTPQTATVSMKNTATNQSDGANIFFK
ncbi:MAG: hypothetical protein PHD21_06330, partial [Flavobacteriales bacterium]|nr:hypothetical protein [Flavobacteriales bacterium]